MWSFLLAILLLCVDVAASKVQTVVSTTPRLRGSTVADQLIRKAAVIQYINYGDKDLPQPLVEKKIVNGNDTDAGQYTFFAAMIDRYEEKFNGCGGSLVAPNFVLTAAHCVRNYNEPNPKRFAWEIGAFCDPDNLSNNCDQASDFREVVGVHVHPNYSGNKINDLVLMRLSGRSSQPYIEPDDGSAVSRYVNDGLGDYLKVMGYGRTSNRPGSNPFVLQSTELQYVNEATCSSIYQKLDREVTGDMLCTYAPFKDTCNGDSGGPVVKEFNGRNVLVGVISWGARFCGMGYPGVNARVGYGENYGWIVDTVCGSANDDLPHWCPGVETPLTTPATTTATSATLINSTDILEERNSDTTTLTLSINSTERSEDHSINATTLNPSLNSTDSSEDHSNNATSPTLSIYSTDSSENYSNNATTPTLSINSTDSSQDHSNNATNPTLFINSTDSSQDHSNNTTTFSTPQPPLYTTSTTITPTLATSTSTTTTSLPATTNSTTSTTTLSIAEICNKEKENEFHAAFTILKCSFLQRSTPSMVIRICNEPNVPTACPYSCSNSCSL